MKTKNILILVGFLILLLSCGGDSEGPVGPEYFMSDIVGTWNGFAKNLTHTITLNLTCDSEGDISGSGVISKWSIDINGKVTGAGTYGGVINSQVFTAAASWTLQVSTDKKMLTGKFFVQHPELLSMDVELNKQ